MTRDDRGWPKYLLGGKVRTSTVGLILAFLLVWWLYQEYKPAPPPAPAPATEVVPSGFLPDPNYTWVPRTDVQQPRRTTTSTTPTTSTPTTSATPTPTPTESTSPTETTTTGSPAPASPGPTPGMPASPGPAPGPSLPPSR